MKFSKIMILFFSVFITFSLAGCQDKTISSVTETTVATVKADETMQDYSKLFELKLYSDKTVYSTTDKIKIWATLKYVGSNTRIRIWHGDPYISFYISDGKDFNTGGAVHDVLSSTELEKDKLYIFDYSKNGGYTAEDPRADFWKKFYAEKYLYLPEGEYTIRVGTAFSLTKDTEKNKSGLSEELKIVVQPGSMSNKISNRQSNKLMLDKNEIEQISISCSLPLFQAFDIKEKEQISSVVNYLTALDPTDTGLDPKNYVGMAYNVKILLDSGAERVFTLSGNRFLMESGGFAYEIPYEDAIEFDTIVANILEKDQTKNGVPSIVGTVISLEAEKTGRSTSCVIQDNENSKYAVDLKDANIIDSTGNGWRILHEKDVVKVFYDKDKRSTDNSVIASTVYLKKSAGR